MSQDGHAAQVLISLAGETQDDYLDNYDELEPDPRAPRASRPTSPAPFAVYDDVNETHRARTSRRAETISLPVVAILLAC